jgi:hypothetical protein
MILILRCSWGRVSTTVGVGLRPSAIVVIDLGRQDCRGLRTVDVLSSHLALLFMPSLNPVWVGLRLIPLAILVPSNGMSWLIDREWSNLIGCGRLARVVHGWVSPMIGLSSGSFNLWMCTSSAELETHSNGRDLGIGHVMVWTSHVDSECWDLSFCLWLCPCWLDGYYHSLSYYRWFTYYHCYAFISSCHIYLLIFP